MFLLRLLLLMNICSLLFHVFLAESEGAFWGSYGGVFFSQLIIIVTLLIQLLLHPENKLNKYLVSNAMRIFTLISCGIALRFIEGIETLPLRSIISYLIFYTITLILIWPKKSVET